MPLVMLSESLFLMKGFVSVLKAGSFAFFHRGPRPSLSGLRPKLGQKRLFIIGSGASIDRLNPAQLREIQNGTSWGINYSFLGPLQPSVISAEKPGGHGTAGPLDFICEPFSSRTVLFSGAVRPHERKLLTRLHKAGAEVRLLPRSPLYMDNPRKLRIFLESSLSALVLVNRFVPLSCDGGSSISRLLSLAIFLGWEEIVLVGIDLGGPYFEQHPFRKEDSGDGGHPNEVGRGELPTSRIISVFAEVARDKDLASVFCGTPDGPLCETLPRYVWKDASGSEDGLPNDKGASCDSPSCV